MKIFIIGSVRDATRENQIMMEDYVDFLEHHGHQVHLPKRDTKQDACGYDICTENMEAIKYADEVHIFYNSDSQGSHFDMGVAFALHKKIVVIENENYDPNTKSFPRMINEWEEKS